MRKRTTAFRKKFIRKLGINTKNFGDRYLELVFEEWPLVETGFDFVLTLKVLEDNVLEEEDRCVTILGRADVEQLVDFLQDLLDRPHC